MPDFDVKGQQKQGLSPKGTVPVFVIPSGPINPAAKRDMALKHAKGEIIAFIDDDAYPEPDWLKNAVINFSDPGVAAVGGPAVTPDSDSLTQKASGAVYASFLVGGNYTYRYIPGKRMEVDDFPSCNFIVRKSVMLELGGFNTSFWPGEDTKLCLDITKVLNKKIIYDPKVLVYHHRRTLFGAHLKQIASYGLHRGYFAKRFPQTSLRLPYFLPSFLVLFVAAGAFLSIFSIQLGALYGFTLSLYLLLVFIFSFSRDLSLTPLVFLGIISTHFIYGIYFLKGLLLNKLKEEK